MVTYGLIGFPLGHSWSESWFSERFRQENRTGIRYLNFPLSTIDQFPGLIHEYSDICGLNVTIPYKEKIIPFLDELEETAADVGAVNTICIRREEGKVKTKGYNTDAYGFLHSADFSGHRHALILGTGGSAKAVFFTLSELGISCLFVSGSQKGSHIITYHDLDKLLLSTHTLIINATPAGMYPETGTSPPIPYQYVTSRHFLYDLVYNPEVTVFLAEGVRRNARIQNGLKMLQIQAEESLRIWDSSRD